MQPPVPTELTAATTSTTSYRHAAEGILTARGGMTSHAAVVARGWGKPCICGCGALEVDDKAKVGEGRGGGRNTWLNARVACVGEGGGRGNAADVRVLQDTWRVLQSFRQPHTSAAFPLPCFLQ